jgi:hypothetical protein
MVGNAEMKAMGRIATLAGKVGQHLWPVLKPSVASGEIDLQKNFVTDAEVRAAIRRGFLNSSQEREANLDLNIGHVSKDELVHLSVWDLKHLYQLFYSDIFGLYLEFPDELMPEALDEFAWPICVPGIISNEGTYQSGNLNIPRWKWTNKSLDEELDLTRWRDAWTRSFIVRVKANWEADEDLKNLSGNDVEKEKTNVMMFRERWILGAFLFWLTGEHLDRETVTLSGSRYRDGGVPLVDFNSSVGEVRVGHFPPGVRNDCLRSRQAVS